jgi:hypothetical protein
MEFLAEHVLSMCTLGSAPRNKPMKQNVQCTFRNPEHLNSPGFQWGSCWSIIGFLCLAS